LTKTVQHSPVEAVEEDEQPSVYAMATARKRLQRPPPLRGERDTIIGRTPAGTAARHLAFLTCSYRFLKAAFASLSVSAMPVFGGGAGLVCSHHTHLISP